MDGIQGDSGPGFRRVDVQESDTGIANPRTEQEFRPLWRSSDDS